MSDKKIVHFVCTGNTYRSRLAEAFFNSKAPLGYTATSSGIRAEDNETGPITWYGQRLIKNNSLTPFMSFSWTQTTEKLLKDANYVVFLTPLHEALGKETFGFGGARYETWNIKDIDEGTNDQSIIESSEKTFSQIKEKVDELINKLQSNTIL